MLRGEVPGHPGVVDDHQADQPLRARPGQRLIRREKKRKTAERDQNRKHNEADRLSPQERAVRFRAVGEVSAAKPMTEPEQGGETEVEQVQRTRLRIVISVSEPKHDRREPERAQHPEAVPHRPPYPVRSRFGRSPGRRDAGHFNRPGSSGSGTHVKERHLPDGGLDRRIRNFARRRLLDQSPISPVAKFPPKLADEQNHTGSDSRLDFSSFPWRSGYDSGRHRPNGTNR